MKFKKFLSLLLSIIMLCTVIVLPAQAKLIEGTAELSITPNITTATAGTDPIDVIYTLRVTPPEGKAVGVFYFYLTAPEGMTLATNKLGAAYANKGGDGYWVATKDLQKKENEDTGETTGIFEKIEYTPASGYFIAYGTTHERNMKEAADIMTIKATIEAGKTGEFTLTVASGGENGEKDLGIDYDGTDKYSTKLTTVPVVVSEAATPTEKVLDSIEVSKAPTKTIYTEGDNFDPEGMEIKAKYSDNTEAVVTGYNVTDGNNLTTGKSDVTISYTENGVVKTVKQPITVNAKPAVVTPVEVPTAKTGLTYTGSELIGVEEGTGYTLTGNKATDAGNYSATATLKEGYKWADESTGDKQIDWTIGKNILNPPSLSKNEFIFDGEAMVIDDYLVGFDSKTMVITTESYNRMKKWPNDYTPCGNTGADYHLGIKIIDQRNYAFDVKEPASQTETFVNLPWRIVRGEYWPAEKPEAFHVEGTYVYNGSEQTAVVKEYDDKTMKIAGNKATNAGEYIITVAPKPIWLDGSNPEVKVNWKIEKAEPIYTVPTGLEGKQNDKLSTVPLPTGFTWKDGNTVMSETGAKTFKATFTPEDTNNYNTVDDIDIPVNVKEEVKAAPAKPVITPNGGSFEDSKLITITCETEDAEIIYTTDKGSTTETYTGPFTITDTTELWARSVKDGVESEIVEAKFTKTEKAHKIIVNNGYASVDKAEKDQTVTISANIPEGEEFDKWIVNSNNVTLDDETNPTTSFVMPGEDVEITASFKSKTTTGAVFTVTFESNGGSAIESQNVEENKMATKPVNPTKAGYTFTGWYTDESCTQEYDFSTPVKENLTLYAGYYKNGSDKEDDSDHSYTGSGASSDGGGGSVKKYYIDTEKADNGKVEMDKSKASQGNVITITTAPEDGYALKEIKVTDGKGKEIKVKEKGNGKYTFAMPSSDVEVSAEFEKITDGTDDTADKDKKEEADNTVIKMQINKKRIFVNNEAFDYDVAPTIVNSRTLVPIRFITEAFDGKVEWNPETREVILTIEGKEIKMTIGNILEKYGVAPSIIADRTFVPVRFVADELGAETVWDDTAKTVTITKTAIESK